MTDRNKQLIRILRVLRDLDRLGGIDLYELAKRYGTSVRTIRRDLAALQEAGLPLAEESDGKRKRWRIAFRDHLSKLTQLLDASHYLALRVAMDSSGPLRTSSALFATLEDLSDKLEDVLGKKERALLSDIDRCLYSYEKFSFTEAAPEVLWPLITAISDKRICRVSYRAPGAKAAKKYRILPLKLIAHGRALYLHATVPRYGNVIVLHLQRLEQLSLTKEKGKPPKDYDPATWESASFGVFHGGKATQYRLRFTEEVAAYVRERTWHPSQKLKKLRNGGLELSFTCSESPEVTSWVISWREQVTVIEPASLRKTLAEAGAWMQKTYGSSR